MRGGSNFSCCRFFIQGERYGINEEGKRNGGFKMKIQKIGIILLITLPFMACGGGGGNKNTKKPTIKVSKNNVVKTEKKTQVTVEKEVVITEKKKLITTLKTVQKPKVWKEIEFKDVGFDKVFICADNKEAVNIANNRIVSNIDNGHDNAIMKAINGGAVINEGELIIEGHHQVGMWADGKGSKAINKGLIKVNGHDNVGMIATFGGTIINDGTIELQGTMITENRDDRSNKAFQLIAGGKLINNGKVIFGK